MAQQSIESARTTANPPCSAGWGERLARSGRALLLPQPWTGRLPAPTSTVSVQLWADASPMRLTAGAVFLAALLAAGALNRWQALDWTRLVLLWLLVDLLWGALWRLAGGRNHLLSLRTAATADAALQLPYMRPNSPAAKLLSLDERDSLPYLVRVAIPALLISLIVAAVLGASAVVCTGVVAAAAIAGWIMRRTLTWPPLLLHAAVLVALPWLLTLLQMNIAPGHAAWMAALALGALWTLHGWGEARLGVWADDSRALLLLGLAQAGMLLLLVLNKTPIWVPIVAVLLLPTWLRVLRRQPPTGLSLWWSAALLVSALALGWR